MARFSILGRDELLVWEDGEVSGFPELLLHDARWALKETPRGLTPTGPFVETATKEGAFLALYPLVEDVEEVVDAPVGPPEDDGDDGVVY